MDTHPIHFSSVPLTASPANMQDSQTPASPRPKQTLPHDTVTFSGIFDKRKKPHKEKAAQLAEIFENHNLRFATEARKQIDYEPSESNVYTSQALSAILKLEPQSPLAFSEAETLSEDQVMTLIREFDRGVSKRGSSGSYNVARAYAQPHALRHPNRSIREHVIDRLSDENLLTSVQISDRYYSYSYFNQNGEAFANILDALKHEVDPELTGKLKRIATHFDLTDMRGLSLDEIKEQLDDLYTEGRNPEAEYVSLVMRHKYFKPQDRLYVAQLFEFLARDHKAPDIVKVIRKTANEDCREVYEKAALDSNELVRDAAGQALDVIGRKTGPADTSEEVPASEESRGNGREDTRSALEKLLNEWLPDDDD